MNKAKLSAHQKAVRWFECDKKEALQRYKSVNPIELPCNIDALTNDIPALKKLVMKLGVRLHMYELKNLFLERQSNSMMNDQPL